MTELETGLGLHPTVYNWRSVGTASATLCHVTGGLYRKYSTVCSQGTDWLKRRRHFSLSSGGEHPGRASCHHRSRPEMIRVRILDVGGAGGRRGGSRHDTSAVESSELGGGLVRKEVALRRGEGYVGNAKVFESLAEEAKVSVAHPNLRVAVRWRNVTLLAWAEATETKLDAVGALRAQANEGSGDVSPRDINLGSAWAEAAETKLDAVQTHEGARWRKRRRISTRYQPRQRMAEAAETKLDAVQTMRAPGRGSGDVSRRDINLDSAWRRQRRQSSTRYKPTRAPGRGSGDVSRRDINLDSAWAEAAETKLDAVQKHEGAQLRRWRRISTR